MTALMKTNQCLQTYQNIVTIITVQFSLLNFFSSSLVKRMFQRQKSSGHLYSTITPLHRLTNHLKMYTLIYFFVNYKSPDPCPEKNRCSWFTDLFAQYCSGAKRTEWLGVFPTGNNEHTWKTSQGGEDLGTYINLNGWNNCIQWIVFSSVKDWYLVVSTTSGYVYTTVWFE